jgi:hypothetical protein
LLSPCPGEHPLNPLKLHLLIELLAPTLASPYPLQGWSGVPKGSLCSRETLVQVSDSNLPLLPNVRGMGLRVQVRGVLCVEEDSEDSEEALQDMETARLKQG